MAVNKVTLGDETLIDLTNDTAEAEDVLEGAYFHTAAGVRTAGTRRNIDVDDELSPTSENPVQNKVIYEALQNIHIDVDDELSVTSENPVQNKVVTLALDQKADAYGRTESGDIVSFYASEHANKNLLGLTVGIQPNQDLHGYSNPWPAGGGKNKLPNIPMNTTRDNFSVVGENGVYTVNATVTAEYMGTTTLTEFTLPAGTYTLSAVKSAQETLVYAMLFDSDGIMQIAASNGQPSTFTLSEATAIRLGIRVMRGTVSNLTVRPMIEVGSTATEYAPVENICPISGWDSVGIEADGVNLLDVSTAEVGTAWNGSVNPARARLVVPLKRNTQYILTMNGTSTLDGVFSVLSTTVPPSTPSVRTFPYSFNSGENDYLVLGFNKTAISQSDLDALKLQLEPGSTASTYKPYSGNRYTIAIGQTVYGGILDVTNGTLTVDRAIVDLGTLNWTYTAGAGIRFRSTTALPNVKTPSSSSDPPSATCSSFKMAPYNTLSANDNIFTIVFAGSFAEGQVWGNCDAYTDATAFKAAVSGVQLVYELTTPITIQLDPVQIAVIRGQTNNIWADAGTVDVTYAADIEAETQSKLNRKAGMLVDTVSGAIASFVPDSTIPDLLDVSVAVEPVQDLHGYNSPWPAGGGKNKLVSISPTSGTESGITYTVYNDGTVKLNGTATANFSLYAVGDNVVHSDAHIASGSYKLNGSATNTYIYVAEEGGIPIGAGNGQEVTVTIDSTKNYRIFVRVSSGDTVNNVIVKPMISVEGGEYEPYSNLCPISGWDAVGIVADGVNLYPTATGSYIYNGITFTLADGEIHVEGTATGRADIVPITGENGTGVNLIRLPAGTYTYSISGLTQGLHFVYGGANSGVPYGDITYTDGPRTISRVVAGGTGYNVLRVESGATVNTTVRIQLEPGSTATTYKPYAGNTYTITLGETVYGGTLDVVNGKMTVDRAAGVFDGSENITWHITADGSTRQNVYCNAHDKYRDIITTGGLAQFEINIFKAITNRADRGQYTAYLDNGYLNMQFPSGMFPSVAELKSWLSANNVQFTYPLATPIVIQLDPVTISTIAGQTNNVWADAGDVSVEYAADIKAYIDQKIAALAAQIVNS